MVNFMARVHLNIKMVINMMVIFFRVRNMAVEFFHMRMDMFTKGDLNMMRRLIDSAQ
jgi:hypothetical protein